MNVEQQLQDLLRAAMRDRDTAVVAAVRSALSAIANAEAVVGPRTSTTTSAHVAGAAAGLGAAEAQRAVLDEQARRELVAQEVADLWLHADRLRDHGRIEQADAAQRGAAALSALIA